VGVFQQYEKIRCDGSLAPRICGTLRLLYGSYTLASSTPSCTSFECPPSFFPLFTVLFFICCTFAPFFTPLFLYIPYLLLIHLNFPLLLILLTSCLRLSSVYFPLILILPYFLPLLLCLLLHLVLLLSYPCTGPRPNGLSNFSLLMTKLSFEQLIRSK
jgi:hypothetical protein